MDSQISEFNEVEFTKRLASHLSENSEEILPKIIKKLCLSLRGGSIIFIKVENWDSVIDQKKFLDWFIKDFWQPLVDEMASVFQEFNRIRFIVALIAKSSVFPTCLSLSDYFCTICMGMYGNGVQITGMRIMKERLETEEYG